MANKPKLIIALIITLIIVNMYQTTKLTNLQNQINNQQQQFNNLNNSINNINNSIYNTMEEFKEENQWIKDINYEVKNVSEDLKEMTVGISWRFNELNKDEQIFLLVEESSVPEKQIIKTDKLPIEAKTDLYYKEELVLPVKAAYSLQVLAEDNNSKRTGELRKVDIYSDLMKRIQIFGHTYGNFKSQDNELTININLFNPNIGAELFNNGQPTKEMPDELRVKYAIIEVYENNNLIKSVDLFKEGIKLHEDTNWSEAEEMFDYDITIEGENIDIDNLRVIAKVEDNLGLLYEKEVELDR